MATISGKRFAELLKEHSDYASLKAAVLALAPEKENGEGNASVDNYIRIKIDGMKRDFGAAYANAYCQREGLDTHKSKPEAERNGNARWVELYGKGCAKADSIPELNPAGMPTGGTGGRTSFDPLAAFGFELDSEEE